MTIETMWYAARPYPPTCNRLIRLPYHDQLGMAVDLAIDFCEGMAGYRNVGQIASTGETYWWWPRENVKHGDWWMLPKRTVRLKGRATDYAEQRAGMRPDGMPLDNALTIELLRLQRRAHAAKARLIAEMIYRARLQIVFLTLLLAFPALLRAGLRTPWNTGEAPTWRKWNPKLIAALHIRPDSDRMWEARWRRQEIIEQYGRRGKPQTREQWERRAQ